MRSSELASRLQFEAIVGRVAELESLSGPWGHGIVKRQDNLPAMLFGAAALEVVAIVVTFVAGAGGHGTYVAAKVFFPYSLGLTRFTHALTPPLIALALVQYPVYALALWAAGSGPLLRIRWVVNVAVHFVAVLAAFRFANSTFTP
ncbi:MAG: hypothetical protein U1E76_07920 [Planctomycetota bacterium]